LQLLVKFATFHVHKRWLSRQSKDARFYDV
jgi:hypothetical protein